MYTKIKFLVRLLLAIVIFTFSSCEKDLYEEAIQQNHNELKNHNIPNIIEKSFEELILDKKFKNAYYKISKAKTNSSFSKTVMEANYNF